MRTPQSEGNKGSLKWIQLLVNDHPGKLNAAIAKKLQFRDSNIQWLSPLKTDEYAEYRDGAFLDLLGLAEFKSKLQNFWPRNGPQWDALGKATSKRTSGQAVIPPVFLVEAKANIPEIMSSLGAKSERSIALIRKSLAETRKYLRCKDSHLWEKGFYQYVNRLAHLHFLRNICSVDAYLIFVYFTGDYTLIPTSQEQWTGALELQKCLLGIKNHRLNNFVAEIYFDVNELK
jgi:hypothetical protein